MQAKHIFNIGLSVLVILTIIFANISKCEVYASREPARHNLADGSSPRGCGTPQPAVVAWNTMVRQCANFCIIGSNRFHYQYHLCLPTEI